MRDFILDSRSLAEAGIDDERAHSGALNVQLAAVAANLFRQGFHHAAHGKLGGAVRYHVLAAHGTGYR